MWRITATFAIVLALAVLALETRETRAAPQVFSMVDTVNGASLGSLTLSPTGSSLSVTFNLTGLVANSSYHLFGFCAPGGVGPTSPCSPGVGGAFLAGDLIRDFGVRSSDGAGNLNASFVASGLPTATYGWHFTASFPGLERAAAIPANLSKHAHTSPHNASFTISAEAIPPAGNACDSSGSPAVATDKQDYEPNETVVITGSGFECGVTVTVRVTRPDGSVVTGDGTDTAGSDTVTIDDQGAFIYNYELDGIEGSYVVDVLDADGAVRATTTFDDSPPTVAADSASVTVNEGSTAANSGTYSDPDSGQNVAITASVGSVTKTGTSSGTWNWSLSTTDGPDQNQTVTITADDATARLTPPRSP